MTNEITITHSVNSTSVSSINDMIDDMFDELSPENLFKEISYDVEDSEDE